MRIAVIAATHPIASNNPLSGIFEWDQAVALKRAGVEVTYLAVDLRSALRRRRLGYMCGVTDGVEWHSIALPVGNVPPRWLTAIGQRALVKLYKRAFRGKETPQLLHAHYGIVGGYATMLAERIGVPLVITEHSSVLNGVVVNPSKVEESAKAYGKATKVLAVSSALQASIKRLTGCESEVMPNMVDMEVFCQCKRKSHEGFRIVTVSNLIALKDTMSLLKAMKEVHIEYPDIELEVVGDGPMRGELEQYAHDNDLMQVVHFHGRLSRAQTASLYEEADCMAMVSRTETFGVVYIEAMAAGLPVIATRCGGPEDFIVPEVGLLVDVGNVEQIKQAIVHFYTHRNDYSSIDIRQYSLSHFSPSIIASRLIEEYNTLIR